MEKWNKLDEIRASEIENIVIRHYTRAMQGYEAHIFWIFFTNEKELKEKWKLISTIIALKIQTKVTLSIERSNFYIFYISNKKISSQIKREIEYDPFCAKKYVLDNYYRNLPIDDRHICEYLEKKLFLITSLKETLNGNEAIHIKKVCLQNFRGFKGKAELNLHDSKGNAASFVLIYAPNGCGKTSIFDGIEYALKGKVDYLIETKKISNFHGFIYHNKDNYLQDASVELLLDDGRSILRKVAPVNEDGDDCRGGSISNKVRDIVGNMKDSDKWNGILLPYAKIENFISARKPEERYTEWFKYAPELKNEQDKFEKESRKLKELSRELSKVEEKIKNINIELNKMDSAPKALDTINELIDQFNQEYAALKTKEEKNVIEELKKNGQVQSYNLLINQCQVLKRELRHEQDQNRSQHHLIEKFIKADPVLLKEKQRRETVIVKEINAAQKIINDSNIYEIKQKELESFNEKIKKINEKIAPYEEIIKYGKEQVEAYCITRTKLREKKKNLEIRYDNFLKSENDEKGKKANFVAQIKQKDIILQTRKDIETVAKEILEIDKILNDLQININENQAEIKSLDKRIIELQNEIEKQNLLRLNEKIASCSTVDYLNCKNILGDSKTKQLQLIVEDYWNGTNEIRRVSSLCKQADNILAEIQKMGIEFQNLHTKNCECPLCHTKFETPEELNRLINQTFSMTNEVMSYRLELSHNERILKKEYRTIYNEVLEKVKKKQEELSVEIDKCSVKKINITKILEKRQQDFLREEDKRSLLLEKLKNKGYEYYERGYSTKQIEDYFDTVIAQKKNLENRVSICDTQIGIFNEKISCTMNESIDCNKLLDELYQDGILLGMVQLWENLQSDFEIEYERLKLQKDNIKDKIEKCKEGIKAVQYSNYYDVAVKKEIVQNLLKEQEEIRNILKEYWELLSYDSVEIMNREQSLRENILKSSCLIEILQQICEENGARKYYEHYIEKNKQLKKEEAQKKIIDDKIIGQKKSVETVKNSLQIALAEYFGQSSMDEIYQKIDAHDVMKHLRYELSFNDNQKGELVIHAMENIDENTEDSNYRPEIYFSTAQLNTVAFSSFFSRALNSFSKLPIQSIFIDDPIGSYDDMNALGFADLIRSLLENSKCQIIMSTHDETIFKILQRKLDNRYYSSCFIELPYGNGIKWEI